MVARKKSLESEVVVDDCADQVRTLLSKKFKGYGGIRELERIPTGIYPFDYSLGGGLPLGRVIQIFGKGKKGKSTLALNLASLLLHSGHDVAYLDLERTVERDRATSILTDQVDNLHYLQTSNADEAFDFLKTAVDNSRIKLYILDSPPYLLPQAELNKDLQDPSKMAVGATLWAGIQPRLNKIMQDSNSCLLLINQERNTMTTYGSPFKPWGGDSLMHLCSYVARLTKKRDSVSGNNYINLAVTQSKIGIENISLDIFINEGNGVVDINTTNGLWFINSGVFLRKGAYVYISDKAAELIGYTGDTNLGYLSVVGQWLSQLSPEQESTLLSLSL